MTKAATGSLPVAAKDNCPCELIPGEDFMNLRKVQMVKCVHRRTVNHETLTHSSSQRALIGKSDSGAPTVNGLSKTVTFFLALTIACNRYRTLPQ